MITYQIKGITNVGRLLRKTLPDEIVKGLAQTIRKEADDILSDAKASIPVASGQTRDALKIRTKNKGLTAQIGIFRDQSRGYIARFLTFGAKPHLITPHKASVLKIGHSYAKSVRHPGMKPHDFLLAKSLSRRKNFQEKLRQTLITVLQRFNS